MTEPSESGTAQSCDHPLSEVFRQGEPDWKNNDQTIWYRGRCGQCGDRVEVRYQFNEVVSDE